MSESSPAATPPLMTLSGWVKKKGSCQGLWHKRFLSISGRSLTISKDDSGGVIEQRIELPLSTTASLVEGASPPRFQIDLPGVETLLFTSDTREEALRWITAVATVCADPQPPSLSMDHFRVISVIGRGFYGKVMLCQKIDTGELYAIKSIHKKRLVETGNTASVITERNIMMKAHHPFIVNLCFAFQSPAKFYLGLEYAPGGELFYHMNKRGSVQIDDARLYAAEIGLALTHLHRLGIVYRDLKPENVLLDRLGHVKLTDFGLSKVLDRTGKTSSFCGTSEYLAPEIVMGRPYGYAIDIWALGILTYEMLVGGTPFHDENKTKLFTNIVSGTPHFPLGFDARVRHFILSLLTKDPSTRPRFNDLKNHPFFEGFDWGMVERREYRPNFIPPTRDLLKPTNFDPEFTSEVAADSLVAAGMGEFGKVPGFSFSDDTITRLG
jgi:serine/threonine protein kinase